MKKLFYILYSIQFLFATSAIQELTTDEPTQAYLIKGEKHYYGLSVPSNKSIHVTLTELESDIDLYVKKGDEVSISLNDCSSSSSKDKDEECILTNTGESSEYTILVYGFQEGRYTLQATIEDPEVIPTLTDEALEDSVGYRESKQYQLSGKEGETITVNLYNLTADADLRININKKADLHSFVCKSTNGGTQTDTCSVTLTKDAIVYASVYGYESANYSINTTQTTSTECITIDELKTKIENNDDVSNVNTSCITNMDYLFASNLEFNQDISVWDVSAVTSMQHMFYEATSFNQNLSSWNTANVTNMNNMFSYTSSFSNQDLSSWNVSKVSSNKYFSYASGEGNVEPVWADINLVLINKAKEYCQTTKEESTSLVCSDIENLVYLVNNEHDLGSSSLISSTTYAVNIEEGKESIKSINENASILGATELIRLQDTDLIALNNPSDHSWLYNIVFYNSLGENVLSKSIDKNYLEILSIETANNGSELIIVSQERTVEEKVLTDTYDISDTSNITLINHTES